jgi:hypothetical protein
MVIEAENVSEDLVAQKGKVQLAYDGVTDHFKQAGESWKDLPALGTWLGTCEVTGVPAAQIFNSLW